MKPPVDPAVAIEQLVRARYPILAIPSWEEERVEGMLDAIAKRRSKKLLLWTVTRGLHPFGTPLQSRKGVAAARPAPDPLEALGEVIAAVDPTIFLFKDLHPWLGQPEVVRKLRDVAAHLRTSYSTLVLVSPHFRIPAELEKDVAIVDFPLPGRKELAKLLTDTVREVNETTEVKIDPTAVAVEPILAASLGLTLKEAENVFARSLVMGGRFTEEDIPAILDEKRQIIRRSGTLEFFPTEENFGSIGGLAPLKDWLARRRLAFTEKARQWGLPYPKGVLLVGVQGCGKSLSAKAVSGLWRLPLLRFDVGAVFSSAVGSSEENMRNAIRAAEGVAPAILWVDEIEKAFAGVQSSAFSDGGTTARVFGSFLTWLSEKSSPVFVIATANAIRQLPPELLRKGRLDEIFFVDLPATVERKEIFAIHLLRRGQKVESFDLDRLARVSAGFSGAEIEEAIVAALFEACEKNIPLATAGIETAVGETVPLSRTMEEEIGELRSWASGRARPASAGEEPDAPSVGRKMEL
jgi:SpoVK/Ycf46/Vps4 family AAA+-type ATPase